MNIHKNLKNEGKSRKNYNPSMIYPVLHGPLEFMPNYSVGTSECDTKFTLKHFGMYYVKMLVFHGNPLYDFRKWGIGLQIQSYLGFYLSQSTKIGVKLQLKHVSFFCWSDM